MEHLPFDSTEMVTLVILITLIGVILSIAGYKNFRDAAMFVTMIAAGLSCKYFMSLYIPTTPTVYWLVSLGVGLVVACILRISMRISITILAASTGLLIAAFVLSLPLGSSKMISDPRLMYSLTGVLIFIFSVLVHFLTKFVLIWSTSILGAFFILIGADYLVKSGVCVSIAIVLVNLIQSDLLFGVSKPIWEPYSSWGKTSLPIGISMVAGTIAVAVFMINLQYRVTGKDYIIPGLQNHSQLVAPDEQDEDVQALLRPDEEDEEQNFNLAHQPVASAPALTTWGGEPIPVQPAQAPPPPYAQESSYVREPAYPAMFSSPRVPVASSSSRPQQPRPQYPPPLPMPIKSGRVFGDQSDLP